MKIKALDTNYTFELAYQNFEISSKVQLILNLVVGY